MRYASLILAALTITAYAMPAAAQPKGPCFFLQPNYQGDPICIAPTQRLPSLGAVIKNKIMSVQIPSGMRVTVCDSDNFGGSCQTLSQSVADFNAIGAAGKVASVAAEAPAAPPPARANAEPPPSPSPPTMRPGPGAQAKTPPPPPLPLPPQAAPPNDPAAARAEPDPEYTRELRRLLTALRKECEEGEKTSCVRLGFVIGENRVRRAALRQLAPELFWWDR
jgi:hypothetical protein